MGDLCQNHQRERRHNDQSMPMRIWHQITRTFLGRSSQKTTSKSSRSGQTHDRSRSAPGGTSKSWSSSDSEKKRKTQRRRKKRADREAYFRQCLNSGPSCYHGECFRNRRNDPFCLCRLPLRRPSLTSHPSESSVESNRDFPAGLYNLGNTCYLNSYLQTLFHMLPVRRIVFEWRYPPIDQREPEKRYGVVVALQSLFACLQAGHEKAIDPHELVNMIGVDVAMQQDVQEFSVLFLEKIDRVLAERAGEEKLQSLFAGKWRSTITCRECKTESSSDCDFHDFALKTEGVSDVSGSISQFFAFEQIDEYECEKCKQRRTADKKLQLTKLPRFLNLHLLRYVYDRDNKVQRKLTHLVEFPWLLDLRPFLTADQIHEWTSDGCRYEVMAILIHQGGAYGGHYFARIRVSTNGRWYTFNDDQVTPYEHQAHEADAHGAYLIVYEKRCDVEERAKFPDIPPYMYRREAMRELLSRQLEVLRALGTAAGFLSNLKARPGHRMVWLPIVWLADVAGAVQTKKCDRPIEAPDMTNHVCVHGRIKGIYALKAVDAFQAQKFIDLLRIEPKPRLYAPDSFCKICNTFLDDGGNGHGETEGEGGTSA